MLCSRATSGGRSPTTGQASRYACCLCKTAVLSCTRVRKAAQTDHGCCAQAYDAVAGTQGLTLSRFTSPSESQRQFPTLAHTGPGGRTLKGTVRCPAAASAVGSEQLNPARSSDLILALDALHSTRLAAAESSQLWWLCVPAGLLLLLAQCQKVQAGCLAGVQGQAPSSKPLTCSSGCADCIL